MGNMSSRDDVCGLESGPACRIPATRISCSFSGHTTALIALADPGIKCGRLKRMSDRGQSLCKNARLIFVFDSSSTYARCLHTSRPGARAIAVDL